MLNARGNSLGWTVGVPCLVHLRETETVGLWNPLGLWPLGEGACPDHMTVSSRNLTLSHVLSTAPRSLPNGWTVVQWKEPPFASVHGYLSLSPCCVAVRDTVIKALTIGKHFFGGLLPVWGPSPASSWLGTWWQWARMCFWNLPSAKPQS